MCLFWKSVYIPMCWSFKCVPVAFLSSNPQKNEITHSPNPYFTWILDFSQRSSTDMGVWRTLPWLRPECNVNCDEYNKPWPRRQDQQDQTMSHGLRHGPARYRRAWSCWKDALGCQHGLFTLVSWADNSEGLQRQSLGDWWYAAFSPHMEANAQDGAATFGRWTMTYGLTVWPEESH